MSEHTKKTQITIDDVSYNFEDLTQEQQELFKHCIDLDRKIGSANFNIDQLKMGRMAFMNALTSSLNTEPEEQDVVN